MLFVLYLGILFDRSIPLRLLKPPFSPFSFPFSFTIFRHDTYAKSKLATYHLDWFRRWALIDLTSFNSSAPTFLSRSPTIPRAEILQEIQVERFLCGFLILQLSTMYSVHMQFAKAEWWGFDINYFAFVKEFLSLYNHLVATINMCHLQIYCQSICEIRHQKSDWQSRKLCSQITFIIYVTWNLPNSQNFVTWNFLLKQSAVC